MRRAFRFSLLALTHLFAGGVGFALGVYWLPILIAPEGPGADQLRSMASAAEFAGQFSRDLADSDALHWGEGNLWVGPDYIAFEGRLAPGPDYSLYLSPVFVETEAEFSVLKSEMAEVGSIRTFENFVVPVPATIDPADFTAAIIWCESFDQFITAAAYRQPAVR